MECKLTYEVVIQTKYLNYQVIINQLSILIGRGYFPLQTNWYVLHLLELEAQAQPPA